MTDKIKLEENVINPNKKFYTYNRVHQLLENVAVKIMKSDFRPDYIISIASGGNIPSRIMRTYLKVPVLTVGLTLYDENGNHSEKPKITQWLDEVNSQNIKNKKVLIVDEIDDTRKTLSACINELWKCGVADVAVVVINNKIKPKLAKLQISESNYFSAEEVDGSLWVCFPWEIVDSNDLVNLE